MVADRGETIHIPIPGSAEVQDVDTNNFTSVDANASGMDVKLDKWRETRPIKITDRLLSLSHEDVIQLFVDRMAEALLADVEAALIAEAMTFNRKFSQRNW